MTVSSTASNKVKYRRCVKYVLTEITQGLDSLNHLLFLIVSVNFQSAWNSNMPLFVFLAVDF